MDIKIVKNKSLQVSDELQEFTQSKVNKLSRYGARLQSAVVTFTERASKNRSKAFQVEIVLHAPGQVLRNSEHGQSFQAALDSVVDELKVQLKKLRTKRLSKNREPLEMSMPAKAPEPKPAPKPAQPRISVKKFTLKPMSVEEAIMQLDLSGHDFFLFTTDKRLVNCVYKRSEGGYGLLVPETEIS